MNSLALKKTDLVRSFAQQAGIALPSDDFQKPEFVGHEFQNLWLKDFSEDEYHADLSSVNRADIVEAQKSARHFASRRQHLGLRDKGPDYEPFRFGRLIHTLILEPEKLKSTFVLQPDFGDMRSSKNREVRDQWKKDIPPGASIVTQEDMVKMFCMAKSIMQNEMACDLMEGAEFESTGFYRDPVTGLKNRFRADIWNPKLSALVDLKSTQDASEKEFLWSAWKYRYDIQIGAYFSGIKECVGEVPETNALIAVESKPPWSCVVHLANKQFLDRGLKDYRRGLDVIAESIEKNEFHGLPGHCELVLPRKAFYE